MELILITAAIVAVIGYLIDKTDRDLVEHTQHLEALRKNYAEALDRYSKSPNDVALRAVSMAAGKHFYDVALADAALTYSAKFGLIGLENRAELRIRQLESDHEAAALKQAA